MFSKIPAQLVDLAVKKFGRLDGMVINHGVLENKTLSSSTLDAFRYTYEVNVFSCLALVSPQLTAQSHHDSPSLQRIRTNIQTRPKPVLLRSKSPREPSSGSPLALLTRHTWDGVPTDHPRLPSTPFHLTWLLKRQTLQALPFNQGE